MSVVHTTPRSMHKKKPAKPAGLRKVEKSALRVSGKTETVAAL